MEWEGVQIRLGGGGRGGIDWVMGGGGRRRGIVEVEGVQGRWGEGQG